MIPIKTKNYIAAFFNNTPVSVDYIAQQNGVN